jgi:hypothetical protein
VSDAPGTGDTAPRPLRLACLLVGLEALALAVIGVWLVVETLAGHPTSIGAALSGAALSLLGAAVLVLGGRGLLRLRPAARTPVVVLQLLALPVSYTLAFQAGRVGYGGPILVVAVAVLYLLFTPPARAALDREPPD